MARKIASKTPRSQRRNSNDSETFQPIPKRFFKSVDPIEAKTENQAKYIQAIASYPLTFGVGPAGVGKTWLCASLAAQALDNGDTQKIIITRPAVEAEEDLGFLPGEIEDKYAPYLVPFLDVLNERLGKSQVEYYLKNGVIEAAPLAYMRGRTFRNAWVILDEAQNTTPGQMKMFLTRIGQYTTVIVNGDESQCDLHGPCGLTDAINRVSYIPSVKIVRFTKNDVVRSGLAQEIVEAYDQTETAERLAPGRKR